jgi:hypothetical protein
MIENFRLTRIPIEYNARYTLGEISGKGLITDVSEGGIALRVEHALKIGDKLQITSQITGDLTLDFTGEVRNIANNIAGILIMEIDSRIKERFLEHVNGMLRIMNRSKREKYKLYG